MKLNIFCTQFDTNVIRCDQLPRQMLISLTESSKDNKRIQIPKPVWAHLPIDENIYSCIQADALKLRDILSLIYNMTPGHSNGTVIKSPIPNLFCFSQSLSGRWSSAGPLPWLEIASLKQSRRRILHFEAKVIIANCFTRTVYLLEWYAPHPDPESVKGLNVPNK